MIVDLPCNFLIDYPEENRAYYSGGDKSKRIMFDLLKNASNGYCMYCGTSLDVETMDVSQIEHSVDKGGNKNQKSKKVSPLSNCKYNLAIACKDCNMKYKKQVVKANLAGRFKKACPSKCSEPCPDYVELRNKYIKDNSIVLQPAGVEQNLEKCTVAYNPLRDIYFSNNINEEVNYLVQQHIVRFHLNGEKRSRNILDICSDIVELNEMGIVSVEKMFEFISKKRQINVIGSLFVSELRDIFLNRTMDDLVDYCKLIVVCSAWI